jgi:hypothetical protein
LTHDMPPFSGLAVALTSCLKFGRALVVRELMPAGRRSIALVSAGAKNNRSSFGSVTRLG